MIKLPELSEPVFRPPSEAGSLILQLTLGCSWNRCTYCAMYRSKKYQVRPLQEVREEIRAIAPAMQGVRRVFLADGDALSAPFDDLMVVLGDLREHFPSLSRVGIYADSRSILGHGPEKLSALKAAGLGIIYFGPESGDDVTLRAIRKGADAARQLKAAHLVREAGIKLSMMILLGVGGVERSRAHAEASGRFIEAAHPEYAAALTVTPIPGTPFADEIAEGRRQLPDRWGMLQELRWMLEVMTTYRGLLHANHASNYLPLKLRMPRDRDRALKLLDEVLENRDESRLRPEWARGL